LQNQELLAHSQHVAAPLDVGGGLHSKGVGWEPKVSDGFIQELQFLNLFDLVCVFVLKIK
jgi:hypothetical protein